MTKKSVLIMCGLCLAMLTILTGCGPFGWNHPDDNHHDNNYQQNNHPDNHQDTNNHQDDHHDN